MKNILLTLGALAAVGSVGFSDAKMWRFKNTTNQTVIVEMRGVQHGDVLPDRKAVTRTLTVNPGKTEEINWKTLWPSSWSPALERVKVYRTNDKEHPLACQGKSDQGYDCPANHRETLCGSGRDCNVLFFPKNPYKLAWKAGCYGNDCHSSPGWPEAK